MNNFIIGRSIYTFVLVFALNINYSQEQLQQKIDIEFSVLDFDVKNGVLAIGGGPSSVVNNCVKIFVQNTDSKFQLQQTIQTPVDQPPALDDFGSQVALSEDADVMIISNPEFRVYDPDGSYADFGRVYIYNRSFLSNSWSLVQTIENDTEWTDFGISLDVSPDGQNIFIGDGRNMLCWYQFNGSEYVEIQCTEDNEDQTFWGQKIYLDQNRVISGARGKDYNGIINNGAINVIETNQNNFEISQVISEEFSQSATFPSEMYAGSNYIIARIPEGDPEKDFYNLYKYEGGEYKLKSNHEFVSGVGDFAITDKTLVHTEGIDLDNNNIPDINNIIVNTFDDNNIRSLQTISRDSVIFNNFLSLDPIIYDNSLYILGTKSYGLPFNERQRSIYIFSLESPTFTMHDANPKFIDSGFPFNNEVDSIETITDTEELFQRTNIERDAIASDGVSKMLLTFPASNPNHKFNIEIKEKFGSVTFPWTKSAYEVDGKYYHFALYIPPNEFPQGSDIEIENIQDIESTKAPFRFIPSISKTDTIDYDLTLVRPPIVLVHGTFDNPEECWKTPLPNSNMTMYNHLTSQGFKVFTCDYSSTNGDQHIGSCAGFLGFANEEDGINTRISSFECNKKVVYENEGGIKDAVNYYRDNLNFACTQADAIGHSMGGVLIRVYASDRDKRFPSYETNYYRNDNFNKGDIHRIITIGSTHHGSDVAWMLNEFAKDISKKGSIFNFELTGLAAEWILASSNLTGAVIDQVPQSAALRRIGPTPIPSHAIAGYVDGVEDIKNNEAEDELYYKRLFQVGMLLYFYQNTRERLLTNIALKWQQWPSHLKEPKDRFYNDYKDLFNQEDYNNLTFEEYDEQFLKEMTSNVEKFKELYTANLELNWDVFRSVDDDFIPTTLEEFNDEPILILPANTSESSINDFDNDEHEEFLDRNYNGFEGEMEASVTLSDIEDLADLMNAYRFFIFKNDWNDGTVRFGSQTGSLQPGSISIFRKVLHSYEPRYSRVITRVEELLKKGFKYFDVNGFTNAGRRLPIWLPTMEEFAAEDVTGCAAACWSGMVPEHAMAWARVAQKENMLILSRPVNPDATELIDDNASTKGMNLKGKSSDWGPQKGLIAVDQRFSKIFSLYNEPKQTEYVQKFNEKVEKLLKDKPEEAIKRQLIKKYTCPSINNGQETEFNAWLVKNYSFAGEAIRFTPVNNDTEVYTWFETNNDCPLVSCDNNCDPSQLEKFEVLANPNQAITDQNEGKSPIYTADYDLLALAQYDREQFNNPNHLYDNPLFEPPEDFFDCEVGVMFDWQRELLEKLNNSVKSLGYKGGNVAHHGPENQFTNMKFTAFECGSKTEPLNITANPYFDYPIVAFEPSNTRKNDAPGIVRIIQMGPPGYKDINLKRYMAEMRRRGYNILPNPDSPSWNWDFYRPYSYENGWDERDYPNLPAYPNQLPVFELSDCLQKYSCNNMGNIPDKPFAQVLSKPNLRFNYNEEFKVYPNPVRNEPINIILNAKHEQIAQLVLTNQIGQSVISKTKVLTKGINRFVIDTQELISGHYYLLIKVNEKNNYEKIIIQN